MDEKNIIKDQILKLFSQALKRKLGDYVTSIKRCIQQTEVALKIIIYNLMILVKKIVEEEYF